MKRYFKYICYFLFFLLSLFIIMFLIKYRPAIILSGSMQPTLSIDDLVFTKEVDKIEVGDIVTYLDDNNQRVMHRVVEINNNDIITKGDANNTNDKKININQIEGVYAFKIKSAGKIFKFIKSPLGLIIILLLIIAILFFPNFKKPTILYNEDEKTDKVKTSKKILLGVIYVIFLIGCIITGYYSKYQKDFVGSDKAVVASWNNNIELTSNNTLDFQNGKNDINVINFNLIYESEVSANYSISLNNILNELGIELSNTENTLSIKKLNNDYIVSFNETIETFDISSLKVNKSTISNNIHATYESDGTKDIYIFKDNINNKIIKIIVDGNKYDLDFINFGMFKVNDSTSKAFTLKISAVETELPILNDLELYATFEQID